MSTPSTYSATYARAVKARAERDARDLLPHLPAIVTRQDIRSVLGRVPGRNPREFLSVERRLEQSGFLVPLEDGLFERNGRPLRRWQNTVTS